MVVMRALILEARTGDVLGELPFHSPKWGVRLNDSGPLSVTVPATSREAADLDLGSLTTSNRRFLALAYGDLIIDAGPIRGRSYDAETGDLEVRAKSLWAVFDKRKALPGAALASGASPATKWSLTIGPTSLASIARELVRVSIQDNPYPGAGALNVVLPAAIGGTHVRTYHGYDLRWQGEALRELTKVQGGPDIRFRPRFMSADQTRVEWVMETGTPSRPLLYQSGQDWEWDGTRPESGVVGFNADEDGEDMAARAWAPGSGQERDMRLGKATDLSLVNLGWPWMETDAASKQEDDQAVLNSAARQRVKETAGPLQSFDVTVRADRDPVLGTYLPGDFARVVVPPGHPILAPGPVRVRIMAMDGDNTQTVKLTVAPFIGSMAGSTYGTGQSVSVPGDPVEPSNTLYPSDSTFPS